MVVRKVDKRMMEALEIVRAFALKNHRLPSDRYIARKMGYKSPRSTCILIHRLRDHGFLDWSCDFCGGIGLNLEKVKEKPHEE